jgi:hypothetical protein
MDWPYAALLAAGLLLIGLATWLVYWLGRSAEDQPRGDRQRGQEGHREGKPEEEVDPIG